MIHFLFRFFEGIAILGCITSACYYAACLWGAASFLSETKASRKETPSTLPPFSILKPLKGTDPEMYESFRSHCLQDYPEYEIIFGVSEPDDPAVADVERLRKEFPGRVIQLVVCPNQLGANAKVSNLEHMVGVARYEYLVVNDSDIRVPANYLRHLAAPLAEPSVGMVTCLYHGAAAPTLGSRLESLGIATDFSPGVLVARILEGGLRFGLGSTLAFRRTDLNQIGSFRSMVDFLADDYELGKRIAALGRKVLLSDVVVETHLSAYPMRGFFAHQIRWARGVRDSRLGGYVGLVATFGLMWSLLLVVIAHGTIWSWYTLGLVALMRFAVALVVGRGVLQDRQLPRLLWLLPLRDLIAAAVWIVSFFGHTVTWRGDRFVLKNGRLSRVGP